MRLVALLLLALPAFGQVRATFEPLAEFEAQRTTGVKNVTLWNVTVNSYLPSVNRGDVERLTDFTELRPSMVEDLIRKASGANGITLVGKTWDQGAPLAGPGLLSWGISASNPWSMGVGAAITLGNIIRGALKGQAPEGFNYIPEFMPDSMPCKDGYCGNWLVMSSKVGKPEKVEVGGIYEIPIQGTITLTPGSIDLRGPNTIAVPISTHPMVDEPAIYDTARIAAMILERGAARGAVE